METKECRHCKQAIHKDARRCQHCQGMQGWISDQKDPRTLLVVIVILLIFVAALFPLFKTATRPLERNEIDRASLSVTNVTYRFGSVAGNKIFVSGEVTNSSDVAAGQTCVRVNLRGQQNTLIDSFVQSIDTPIIPAKGTARFRIVAETPARPDGLKKAEVVVEKSRARGRWD